MQKLFTRKFFILDEAQILKTVWESCKVPCQAAKLLNKELVDYKTETKPEKVATFFNADVIEEARQKILLVKENLTSFAVTCFIKDQTKQTLIPALKNLMSQVKLGPIATVRVDGQSSLASIANNQDLKPDGIILEVGHSKNKNKNGPAERGVRQLREHIVKRNPKGGQINQPILSKATSNFNDIIRYTGRSARELYLGRDSQTGEKLNISDKDLSDLQYERRSKDNIDSAKAQAGNGPPANIPKLDVGDQVFVKSDRSKSHARDAFIVLEIKPEEQMALIQKFPMLHLITSGKSICWSNFPIFT